MAGATALLDELQRSDAVTLCVCRDASDEMIERYPQHFAVSTPEDIAWMKAYVAEHDWVVDEVRFDPTWAEDESSVFDLMRTTGVIGDDVTDPKFLPTEGVQP